MVNEDQPQGVVRLPRLPTMSNCECFKFVPVGSDQCLADGEHWTWCKNYIDPVELIRVRDLQLAEEAKKEKELRCAFTKRQLAAVNSLITPVLNEIRGVVQLVPQGLADREEALLFMEMEMHILFDQLEQINKTNHR